MSEKNGPTRIALIRHAQTEWNRSKRIQGQLDSPLTPEGEVQAKEWAGLLLTHSWNRIISSDTGRAAATTSLINNVLNVPVHYDSRLREQDWGEWTGKTIRQVKEEFPQVLAEVEAQGWAFCPPGGEERTLVLQRSDSALREASEKWPGENILVVTHEGVIRCLIYRLLDRRFVPSEPAVIKPYHLHWLSHDGEGFRLESLNALSLHPTLNNTFTVE